MKSPVRPPIRPGCPRHGVALIEALIALVVMSFGMLALVGVQATLRLNSDIGRQRAEATRIASQEMELVRSFVSVAKVNGLPGRSWDEIGSRTVDPVTLPDGTSNTSYRLERTVSAQGATQKSVHVVVSWRDRTDTAQSVTFDSVVVAAAPALTALLRIPMQMTAAAQRSGRHPTIPPVARDLGDGRSALKPLESGNAVWVFSNTTGLITSLCIGTTAASTAALASDNLGVCNATTATLVAGTVNFNLRGSTAVVSADSSKSVFKPISGGTLAWVIDHVTSSIVQACQVGQQALAVLAASAFPLPNCNAAAQSIAPFNGAADAAAALGAADSTTPLRWPALNLAVAMQNGATNVSSSVCYANAPASAAAANAQTTVNYYCAVVPSDASGWGGQFNLTPLAYADAGAAAWSTATDATGYRVCRYTSAASDYTTNTDHPKVYCKVASANCTSRVTTNLLNQNFLVVAGTKACPTDVAADPASGDFINTNTIQHQP